MQTDNALIEQIAVFNHTNGNQKVYFDLLSNFIASENEDIQSGRLRGAPIFPSETLKAEEIEKTMNLKSLLYLNLEFINQCNLGCEGCWNGYSTELKCFDEKERHSPNKELGLKLSLSKYFEIIDEAKELGVQYIDFIGGGEPLISDDFFTLIEYAYKKGIKCETFTNGTLIDEQTAKLLYHFEVIPFVKVYSLDPKRHDKMVNREGAHEKVLNALEHLTNAGYGKDEKHIAAMECIITKENHDEIPDMWRYARQNNLIPYFERFVGLEYFGSSDNLLNSKELRDLWLGILKIDREEFGYAFPLLPLRIGYTCSSAYFSVYIQSDGVVRPCAGSFVEVGNLAKQSLLEVLQASETLRDLRNLKTTNQGECKNCPYFELEYCPGCRGMANIYYEDITRDDPLCFHLTNNMRSD